MTSPARLITVACPRCGREYETWHRASFNLGMGEEWTPEEIEAQTTGTCPQCGHKVRLTALVVDGDVWRWRGAGGR